MPVSSQPHLQELRSQNFQQLRTDDSEFQIFRGEETPTREDQIRSSTKFRQFQFEPESGSAIRGNLHRLSSELKEISYNQNRHRLSSELKEISYDQSDHRRREERKHRKRQQLRSLFTKISECFGVVLQTINLAFSHLVCMREGKSKKFKVQGLYIASLKAFYDSYLNKLRSIKHTEELIQINMQFCEVIMEKVPIFSSKMIDPSVQVSVPLPSQLFKSLMV